MANVLVVCNFAGRYPRCDHHEIFNKGGILTRVVSSLILRISTVSEIDVPRQIVPGSQ
ncbi:MAG: hypothetical protein HGA93_01870 [Methanothrix sp.]|nr:hypothetical protein [Methanothrix sp.]